MKTKFWSVCCLVFLATILQSCNLISKQISGRKASRFAVQRLKEKGVKHIKICKVRWIAAPLGGFLINAKGSLVMENKHFSVFRIGVRDGTDEREGENKAGEEFVFIAMGKDDSGKTIWHPEPGPDYKVAEGEVYPEGLLAYEFLGNIAGYPDDTRANFESLLSIE